MPGPILTQVPVDLAPTLKAWSRQEDMAKAASRLSEKRTFARPIFSYASHCACVTCTSCIISQCTPIYCAISPVVKMTDKQTEQNDDAPAAQARVQKQNNFSTSARVRGQQHVIDIPPSYSQRFGGSAWATRCISSNCASVVRVVQSDWTGITGLGLEPLSPGSTLVQATACQPSTQTGSMRGLLSSYRYGDNETTTTRYFPLLLLWEYPGRWDVRLGDILLVSSSRPRKQDLFPSLKRRLYFFGPRVERCQTPARGAFGQKRVEWAKCLRE